MRHVRCKLGRKEPQQKPYTNRQTYSHIEFNPQMKVCFFRHDYYYYYFSCGVIGHCSCSEMLTKNALLDSSSSNRSREDVL